MDEAADPKENYDEFDGIESDEPELDAGDYDPETDQKPEHEDKGGRKDPRKRYRRFDGIR